MLYSGKVVVFGQSGCIRAKVVLFEAKWFYSVKLDIFGQFWLFSGNNGCNREMWF